MKKLLTSVAMLSVLGLGVANTPAYAQGQQAKERQQQRYWNESDVGLWESDNFESDTYGFYDNDFNWDTEDDSWSDWYGNADGAWNTYDDIGDEGWLDV